MVKLNRLTVEVYLDGKLAVRIQQPKRQPKKVESGSTRYMATTKLGVSPGYFTLNRSIT